MLLRAVNSARKSLKPNLPPWAHKALRVAWYRLVLPPARLYANVRELAGAHYSLAPPGHVLAQYGIESAAAYARIGDKTYTMIQQHLDEQGLEIPADARILDFGCGAAGALSAFHRHYPQAEAYGCDIKADVIGWVRRYRPELTVVRNDPLPPLPEDFTEFDLVYAISVWTHMPESACSAWLQHMHSRIKPGGLLFFTVVEPSTGAERHGFDPERLTERVRANGGCLYDPGTDMTYIQKEWLDKEIGGRFLLRYCGPLKGHWQAAVVLEQA